MNVPLDQIIYGRPIVPDQPAVSYDILATSGAFTLDDIQRFQSHIPLNPRPVPSASDSQTAALFRLDDGVSIFARTHNQNDDVEWPVYQYIRVPDAVVVNLAGHLQQLMELIETPIPPYNVTQVSVDGLELNSPDTWSLDKRLGLLKRLLKIEGITFEVLHCALSAALDERKLWIRNFPGTLQDRLQFVEGLMMLLPARTCPVLTFATHVSSVNANELRIIFNDDEAESPRHAIDWHHLDLLPQDITDTQYTAWLRTLWNDDLVQFVDALREMETLSIYLMSGNNWLDGLNVIAARHQIDRAVQSGEVADVEQVMTVLTGPVLPENSLRIAYVEQLLHHALNERDTEAARVVAALLDDDPELDDAVSHIFDDVLLDQPDAVYVFLRTRMSKGVDEKWLPRIKNAAGASLTVAIESGDTETIVNWLKLISREPSNYELIDVLREGVKLAQPRAREDGKLGIELINLALRRFPDIIDELLDDKELMDLLPDPMQDILCHGNVEPMTVLANDLESVAQGREVFLVGLARLLKNGRSVNSACVRTLWGIYHGNSIAALPDKYNPETILEDIINHRLDQLTRDSLQLLLVQMLASHADDLFMQTSLALSEHEALFPLMATVLEQSGRSIDDIMDLCNRLTSAGLLDDQQRANVYITLLTEWDWHETTRPLVETLVRLLNKHPDLTTTPRVIWRILEIAAAARMEGAARTATKRLLERFSQVIDELDVDQLVLDLVALNDLVRWSNSVRSSFIAGLRELAHDMSILQLQRIDKQLESQKSLEDLRGIFQTTLALHKAFGQRSLLEFAEEVRVAFTLLGALSGAFDPSPKHQVQIDAETLRVELETQLDEITPDERHVLAKNLKELAQLIAFLSEHRTKSSLMRSGEAVERQLYTGEQSPQSAVDVMKWMSGYLEGAQGHEDI